LRERIKLDPIVEYEVAHVNRVTFLLINPLKRAGLNSAIKAEIKTIMRKTLNRIIGISEALMRFLFCKI